MVMRDGCAYRGGFGRGVPTWVPTWLEVLELGINRD